MEVGIRKRAWQRDWRYPAYLWSLRWVYAVKKPEGWYTPYTRVYPQYTTGRRVSPPLDRYQIILLGDWGTCVNNLPKVVTWKWNGRESNPRPFVSRANTLTIIPPGHILRQQSFLLMFCAKKIHSNIVKSCFTSKVQSAMHKKAWNSSFKVCFVSVCFGTIGLFLQEEAPRTQTSSDHYPSGI